MLPRPQGYFLLGGTVQTFARPFMARGVKIFSAWAANAVPVAEYMVEEFKAFTSGAPTKYSVTEKMLETMA